MTKRKGLPRLSPVELEAFLDRLQSANISARGKRYIEASIRAAANPDGETPEVIMRTMPKVRRDNMKATVKAVTAVVGSVGTRGKAALMGMTDAEWDALVNGD